MRPIIIFFSLILFTTCNSSEESSSEENNVITNTIEAKEKFLQRYDNTIWKKQVDETLYEEEFLPYIRFSNTTTPIWIIAAQCIKRVEGTITQTLNGVSYSQNRYLDVNEENRLIYKSVWATPGNNGEPVGSLAANIKYEVYESPEGPYMEIRDLDEDDNITESSRDFASGKWFLTEGNDWDQLVEINGLCN